MSVRTRAGKREDGRWDVCRRCRHYRVEHATDGARCLTQTPRTDEADRTDRCDCRGFDPPT